MRLRRYEIHFAAETDSSVFENGQFSFFWILVHFFQLLVNKYNPSIKRERFHIINLFFFSWIIMTVNSLMYYLLFMNIP